MKKRTQTLTHSDAGPDGSGGEGLRNTANVAYDRRLAQRQGFSIPTPNAEALHEIRPSPGRGLVATTTRGELPLTPPGDAHDR